jgi:chorismate mutase/prephenate dehydratase
MGQDEVDNKSDQQDGAVCDTIPDLCELRNAIDGIDEEILQLINRRLRLAQQVGNVKKQSGTQIVDSKREIDILNRLTALNKGPLNPTILKHIFIDIIAAARSLQQSQRVAFLGPKATFTHLAGMYHFGYSVTYASQLTIREIFNEVEKGACRYGVVPVENSVEGSVRHTLDLFFESELKICAERYQPVSYDLVANNLNIKEIDTVYAHPQAFAHCRNWLGRHLPQAALKECGSTAYAIRKVKKKKNVAAIAASDAAAMFGLEALASKIEDFFRSATRFLIIGKENVRPTGKDKTSLMFALSHIPGALSQVLEPFAQRDINLLKIESRPTKHENWSHFFFIDIEGHMEDEKIREAVDLIKPLCLYFRWLGSYPLASIHQ